MSKFHPPPAEGIARWITTDTNPMRPFNVGVKFVSGTAVTPAGPVYIPPSLAGPAETLDKMAVMMVNQLHDGSFEVFHGAS